MEEYWEERVRMDTPESPATPRAIQECTSTSLAMATDSGWHGYTTVFSKGFRSLNIFSLWIPVIGLSIYGNHRFSQCVSYPASTSFPSVDFLEFISLHELHINDSLNVCPIQSQRLYLLLIHWNVFCSLHELHICELVIPLSTTVGRHQLINVCCWFILASVVSMFLDGMAD